MTDAILAIDQGTTSTKALLVDASGRVRARGQSPLCIAAPRPGWVTQDASELWESVRAAVADAVAGAPGVRIVGVAVSNQRETVVAWEAASGRPVAPAISWQDQRGDEACRALATAENAALVRHIAGLDLGAMFSATKIAWLLDAAGRDGVRVGTVDAWLLDRLTRGQTYATEAGNASRTLLLDLRTRAWSPELCALFGVDPAVLPQVRPSTGPWGEVRGLPGVPDGTPIVAVLGDSHAALYGHWALAPAYRGVGKATYGTGSSVMLPANRPDAPVRGVGTTLAWADPNPQWALEGNILYSGAGMDWLARTLGVAPGAAFAELAAEASGSRATVFVPALNGLGAPWWDASARAELVGMDAATTRAEIALAGLESVAHQVCDVVEAMDPRGAQLALHAGGGATASGLLMQTQADLLGRPLLVSSISDISPLGAAALGFAAVGVPFEPGPELAPRVVEPGASGLASAPERRAAWRAALVRQGVGGARR